jgi:hypothetical protein
MNTTSTPNLAPPGAGLPKLELFIARRLFAWKRWRGTRAGFTALFKHERDRLLASVQSLSPEQAAQRVLIKRPRGLEDSSRFWSAWMVLDHLRIVNTGCARVIGLLAHGKSPERAASTAAVKPSAEVDETVVAAFQEACDLVLTTVAEVPDLRTKARHAHPWFGPLDAADWQAMGAFHMNLHRRQMERIIAGL